MTSKNEILLPISALIALILQLRDIPGIFHRQPVESIMDKHSGDISRFIKKLDSTSPELEELLLISSVWDETIKNFDQELLR